MQLVRWFVAAFGCVCLFSSCNKKFVIKDGDTAYQLNRFHTATQMLRNEYSKTGDQLRKRELAAKVGDAYRNFNQTEAAEEWYKKALDDGAGQTVLFKYGLMLKMNEKYDEAGKVFRQYQKISAGGFEGKKQAEQCKLALEWKAEENRLRATNLEKVNSQQSDFGAALYKGNPVFASGRADATGDSKTDWNNEKPSDLFLFQNGTVQNFSPVINTPSSDASASFSTDGKEIFFTRCSINPKANEFCQIYYSLFDNGAWSEPVKLELMNDSVNVGDPHLTKDGGMLLFVSNHPGGFGGTDIYMVERSVAGWGTPKNLSASINTVSNERYPWTDEKGNLYFASDGWPGMGGLDVFKAAKSKSGWSNPQNLKAPVNSGADDFSYVIVKYKQAGEQDSVLSTAFVTSSRKGGKGGDDIYRIDEVWVNTFALNGRTTEKEYANPESPDSKLLGMKKLPKTRVELRDMRDTLIAFQFSDTNGFFNFKLKPETDYRVFATRNGYFNAQKEISTRGLRNRDTMLITLFTELELEKIFPQKEIVIPNIYYDYDKATLRPESMSVLDSLFTFFRQNPDLTIEIGSHTDSRGSDEYNLKLSQSRAQSVVDYMITKGIPSDKLIARGYGETRLTNSCGNNANCTEEEHQRNRRTTFRVVSQRLNLQSIEPENITVDPKPEEEE